MRNPKPWGESRSESRTQMTEIKSPSTFDQAGAEQAQKSGPKLLAGMLGRQDTHKKLLLLCAPVGCR